MEPFHVSSSVLTSVSYNTQDSVLLLEFQNGGTYTFFHVPKYLFLDLLAASSKGQFFNKHIRNRYPFMRLEQ